MLHFVFPNSHLGGREAVVAIISSSDEKHLRRFWSFNDLLNRVLCVDQFSSNISIPLLVGLLNDLTNILIMITN